MTDKLSGIKHGDRVRVTFEAEVLDRDIGGDVYVMASGAQGRTIIRHRVAAAQGFKIEVIEKPLAVGDRVRGVTSGDAGKIVWMSDTHVVIVGSSYPCPLVKHISNVERIS